MQSLVSANAPAPPVRRRAWLERASRFVWRVAWRWCFGFLAKRGASCVARHRDPPKPGALGSYSARKTSRWRPRCASRPAPWLQSAYDDKLGRAVCFSTRSVSTTKPDGSKNVAARAVSVWPLQEARSKRQSKYLARFFDVYSPRNLSLSTCTTLWDASWLRTAFPTMLAMEPIGFSRVRANEAGRGVHPESRD